MGLRPQAGVKGRNDGWKVNGRGGLEGPGVLYYEFLALSHISSPVHSSLQLLLHTQVFPRSSL